MLIFKDCVEEEHAEETEKELADGRRKPEVFGVT